MLRNYVRRAKIRVFADNEEVIGDLVDFRFLGDDCQEFVFNNAIVDGEYLGTYAVMLYQISKASILESYKDTTENNSIKLIPIGKFDT